MAKVIKRSLSGLLMLLMPLLASAQQPYAIHYTIADSASQPPVSLLKNSFPSQRGALEYIFRLQQDLHAQGFISASVDSVSYDSTGAVVHVFMGPQYRWAHIRTYVEDNDILSALRWNESAFQNKTLSFDAFQQWQQRILDYLDENGHPFGKVFLDSIQLVNQDVQGWLKIDRGPAYKIDSIRVYGNANVRNLLLQQHLDIYNGSPYNKKKLMAVTGKLAQLPYIEEERPSNITLLGTGSVLNLYLKNRRNSQFNALIGLQPNSEVGAENKFQLTADVHILLHNALSAGESIGITWQKLQPESQSLQLLYAHPFVFRSPFGLKFNFNMFRKDSVFTNLNGELGASYAIDGRQTATLFIQKQQTIVNNINTARVLFTRSLPEEGDVSSTNLGVSYGYNSTDYRPNPRKGGDFILTVTAGTRKLKKNNQILELKDGGNPSFKFESLYDTVRLKTYQFRAEGMAARFFPLGRQGTLKTALHGGIFQSPNIFRNELFQIGGNRLLRGFDEQSQYVSQYGVGTLEYRYLIGQNSFFFAFADGGWGRFLDKTNHGYIGTGLGISFQPKSSMFQLALAVGKRDDTEFNLRQSKVHVGFINYF